MASIKLKNYVDTFWSSNHKTKFILLSVAQFAKFDVKINGSIKLNNLSNYVDTFWSSNHKNKIYFLLSVAQLAKFDVNMNGSIKFKKLSNYVDTFWSSNQKNLFYITFSCSVGQVWREHERQHPLQLRASPQRPGRTVHGRRRDEEVHRNHHKLGLQIGRGNFR